MTESYNLEIPILDFDITNISCLCKNKTIECDYCKAIVCDIHGDDHDQICNLCSLQLYELYLDESKKYPEILKLSLAEWSSAYDICSICDMRKNNRLFSTSEGMCYSSGRWNCVRELFVCADCINENETIAKKEFSNYSWILDYEHSFIAANVSRLCYTFNMRTYGIIETARKKKIDRIKKELLQYLLCEGIINIIADYCGYIRKLEYHLPSL